jgi:hypothetical protein
VPARSVSPKAALALAALVLFFALRTFVLPGVPVLFGGDQGFFWLYGERMLRGDLPYRDFFQFTPPGADVIHLAAFALFGPRIWVTSALIVVAGALLSLVVLALARRMMTEGAALVATGLFVVFDFGESLSTTHHTWSELFALSAVLAAGDARSRVRALSAGALLALATFCTQTHGALALLGVACFLFVRGRRPQLAPLFVGFVGVLALAGSYFVVRVGGGLLVSDLVVYVARFVGRGASFWELGLPEALGWRTLPALSPYLAVYAAIPVALALFGREWLRGRLRDDAGERALLLGSVGVAMLLGVLPSLTWVRVFAVASPWIVLFVYSVDRLGAARSAVLGSLAVSVVCVACALVRSTYRHHPRVVLLPGGAAAVDASTGAKLSWLTAREPPGASLFVVDRPSLYLPLGLHPPIALDGAVPGRQTTVEQAERATRELTERGVRALIWHAVLDEQADADPTGGMSLLRTYVHERYARTKRWEDGDELWERE